MPFGPYSELTHVIEDVDENTIQTTVYGAPYAADGTNYVANLALQVQYTTALAAIIIGRVISLRDGGNYVQADPPPITNLFAQTITQWRFNAVDSVTGANFTLRYGTADLDQATVVTQSGKKRTILDLSVGVGLDMKTAFDALVVNRDTGNPAVLDSVELVQ